MSPIGFNFELAVHPSPEEIAGVLGYLPSSPNVLPRLCGLLHEKDVSLQELRNLLRLDPGLTARVLQLGNQLATARGLSCLSLEDAMQQIGFNRLAAMISQVAKAQVFSRPVSLYGLDAEELWRWSVSCALAAELLAEETGEDPSIAYTVGLLHAVGIVAIDEWVLQKAPSIVFMPRDGLCDFVESERALLGCTQSEVGVALMRRWSFPVTIVDPLRRQNALPVSIAYSRMACLLSAAKWLRTVVCLEDERRSPPPPDAALLRPLRITPACLSRFVVDIRIRVGQVRNLVEVIAA